MRYLVDTSVFLWSLGAERKWNKRAAELLVSDAAELYLSSASSWEIVIKFALGSLTLPSEPVQFVPQAMRAMGIRALDITHAHALEAGRLAAHHRDPFDRLLIAQARTEGMTLLTADRIFERYKWNRFIAGSRKLDQTFRPDLQTATPICPRVVRKSWAFLSTSALPC